MAEGGRKGSGGCLRASLIGCGVVALLGLVAVVGVVTNLDVIKRSGWFRSISEGVETAKTEVHRSMEIRQALLERFPADQIGVNVSFSSSNGVSERSITVSIQEPRFELSEDRVEAERTARGIALEVTRLHPEIDKYDRIVVQIVRRFGPATISTSSDQFVFSVDELVGEGVSSAPEPSSSGESETETGR